MATAGKTVEIEHPSSLANARPSHQKSNGLILGASSSLYHQHCISKDIKARATSAPPRTRHPKDYELCNRVAHEMIWEERVRKERNLQKKWEANLGFLKDYDQYGNKLEVKGIPTSVPSVYSAVRHRPLTASREYGYRVQSAPSRQMQSLELQTRRVLKRHEDIPYTY